MLLPADNHGDSRWPGLRRPKPRCGTPAGTRGRAAAPARTGGDDQEGCRGGVPLGDQRPDPQTRAGRPDPTAPTSPSGWQRPLPEQKQQLAAYVDWEQSATRIVEVAPLLVPGILQTREYSRDHDGRASRPTRSLCEQPPDSEIGGRFAMAGRLDHLLAMAAKPNIDLRGVPDHQGWHPGLEGAFAVIESPRPASGRRQVLVDRVRRDPAIGPHAPPGRRRRRPSPSAHPG